METTREAIDRAFSSEGYGWSEGYEIEDKVNDAQWAIIEAAFAARPAASTFPGDLRDWLAGMAMQGMLAQNIWPEGTVAVDSLGYADAYLAERKRRGATNG